MGDFNLSDVNWLDLSCGVAGGLASELVDLTLEVLLHQFVHQPIRFMVRPRLSWILFSQSQLTLLKTLYMVPL